MAPILENLRNLVYFVVALCLYTVIKIPKYRNLEGFVDKSIVLKINCVKNISWLRLTHGNLLTTKQFLTHHCLHICAARLLASFHDCQNRSTNGRDMKGELLSCAVTTLICLFVMWKLKNKCMHVVCQSPIMNAIDMLLLQLRMAWQYDFYPRQYQ